MYTMYIYFVLAVYLYPTELLFRTAVILWWHYESGRNTHRFLRQLKMVINKTACLDRPDSMGKGLVFKSRFYYCLRTYQVVRPAQEKDLHRSPGRQ